MSGCRQLTTPRPILSGFFVRYTVKWLDIYRQKIDDDALDTHGIVFTCS